MDTINSNNNDNNKDDNETSLKMRNSHLDSPKLFEQQTNLICETENPQNKSIIESFNNMNLPKLPGWRNPCLLMKIKNGQNNDQTIFSWSSSSSSLLATTTNQSIDGNNKDNQITAFKSDTSISSNGPLKEFILNEKPQICHPNPKISMKFDSKILQEAAEQAEQLERQKLSSLLSISDSDKKLKTKHQQQPNMKISQTHTDKSSKNNNHNNNNDEINPLLRSSLQHIKLFSIELQESGGNDNESNDSIILIKSNMSLEQQQQPQPPQQQSEQRK